MKTLKLAIHSFIDVITNSSTEMFVTYTHCLQPCKDMIDEMIKAFYVEPNNIEVTWDDIFNINLVPNDWEDSGVNIIEITAKESKYQPLANAIMKMLSSADTREVDC